MPNTNLIRTFAQTFGLPYTPESQNLPALADKRHLHLGKLADFYYHYRQHMAGRKSVCRLLAGNANLVPAMAALCGFARYLERLGVWLEQQGETIFANRRLARKWAVFGNMFDDSILFADTAVPGSPVYWLMTGHGTVENRRLVAPSMAVLIQTLLAIHPLRTRAAGFEAAFGG